MLATETPAVVAVVTLLVRLRNGKVVPGPQSRAIREFCRRGGRRRRPM